MTHEECKVIILNEIKENEKSWPLMTYDHIKEFIIKNVNNQIWSDKKSALKKCPSMTSYGLKHVIERNGKSDYSDYQGYCQNNWVKFVLIELGYDICYEQDDPRFWCEDYQKWITEPEYVLDNSVNYIWRKRV